MKKSLFILLGLFLSLNLAFANDLLFKATQGEFNENSFGVKKLSEAEAAQVKGGLYLYPQAIGQFIRLNRYGQNVWYKEYYGIIATQSDTPAMRSFFSWLTIVDPANEVVTIETTYDFIAKQLNSKFVVVNTKTMSHRYRVIDHPTSQQIYNKFVGEVELKFLKNLNNLRY